MELTVEKLPNIYGKTLGFDTQIYPQAQKKKKKRWDFLFKM